MFIIKRVNWIQILNEKLIYVRVLEVIWCYFLIFENNEGIFLYKVIYNIQTRNRYVLPDQPSLLFLFCFSLRFSLLFFLCFNFQAFLSQLFFQFNPDIFLSLPRVMVCLLEGQNLYFFVRELTRSICVLIISVEWMFSSILPILFCNKLINSSFVLVILVEV